VNVGSLCTGVGGLDLAAHHLWGDVDVRWVSEIDVDASEVLAARWSDVPNVGDITTVDPDRLDPVDVITAGFPCQPVSQAGRRRGADDDRWLWPHVARIVDAMRPATVIIENVPGLVTIDGGSLFGGIVDNLQRLGYKVGWTVMAAAEIGACHRRRRVFVVASTADTPPPLTASGPVGGGVGRLMPTPTASDHRGPDLARRHRPRSGGDDLCTVVERLLPTPVARDARGGRNATRIRGPESTGHLGRTLCDVAFADWWGEYRDAIGRHERALGRPAPPPVVETARSRGRLNPRFTEWMMMLPDGWVCDIVDRRAAALRLLGNAVVPAQAAEAVRRILGTPTLFADTT